MNIIVTGGLGFIGHNVVRMLEQQGHIVAITDIQSTYGLVPREELDYLISERKKGIRTNLIHKINITDQDGIDWFLKTCPPDVIIHLASFPRQKVVNANPQWGSRVMSEGLLNLLEKAVKFKARKFVYVSSSMVYGDFIDNVRENDPCNPIGQYGIMKLAGEWLVKDYTRMHGLNHVIIRPSAVYGPVDVEDRVVSKFLLTAMRGGTIQVNGENESLDFTYVEDTARGIVGAATNHSADNKTYNITRGHGRSLLEAAELAVKIAGHGSIQVNNRDLNFPSRGSLNIDAARSDFGYNPQVDIEEGFKNYYNWLNNSVYWSKAAV